MLHSCSFCKSVAKAAPQYCVHYTIVCTSLLSKHSPPRCRLITPTSQNKGKKKTFSGDHVEARCPTARVRCTTLQHFLSLCKYSLLPDFYTFFESVGFLKVNGVLYRERLFLPHHRLVHIALAAPRGFCAKLALCPRQRVKYFS